MDPGELKLTSASNIINLRTAAGMTQAELGARLNYSDKTISKWERGEAIPDAYVLTQLAEIFGVSVDYLLSSHDAWEPPAEAEKETPQYSAKHIIAVCVLGVWTMALYHPAALLRDPRRKPEAFEDLKTLQAKIREVCDHTY